MQRKPPMRGKGAAAKCDTDPPASKKHERAEGKRIERKEIRAGKEMK